MMRPNVSTILMGIAGLVVLSLFGSIPTADAASCDLGNLNFIADCSIDENLTIASGYVLQVNVDVTVTISSGEGFDISGKSLNPMETMQISGPEKYEGTITITQTAKYSDIWNSEDGREFQINESGSVVQINDTYEPVEYIGNISNRYHASFAEQMNHQKEIAAMILLEMCTHCFENYADFEEAWSLPVRETDRMQVIQDILLKEQLRATQFLPVSVPAVEKTIDTRTLKQILHDEIVLEKLLSDKLAYQKIVYLNSTQN